MNKLNVLIDFGKGSFPIGSLYLSLSSGRYVFAYDKLFLSYGLEISPYKLPLSSDTVAAELNSDLYDLHGVFADSLPDDWGKKVQDSEFQKIGRLEITALDRLAFVGKYGIGALRYEPAQDFKDGYEIVLLADLRKTAQLVLAGHVEKVTDALLHSGGAGGGARSKFLVDIDVQSPENIRYSQGLPEGNYFPAILKVPVRSIDVYQRIEYAYSQMASKAGIIVPDTFLLESGKRKSAYFAIKRFDITPDRKRLHTHTFAGLLGVNIREGSPDYTRFLRVTEELTRDHRQVVEGFRRMVFNYLGANLDDHAKNISFAMNELGKWSLAPAYDLGYSTASNGLHSMAINGKRMNPTMDDFEQVAESFDIKDWKQIIEKIAKTLSEWPWYAEKAGVSDKFIKSIRERIKEQCGRVSYRRNKSVRN